MADEDPQFQMVYDQMLYLELTCLVLKVSTASSSPYYFSFAFNVEIFLD